MELNKLLHRVREENPLIHCITNPISINQCANAILSVGARPIMAEHPREVGEITETALALMLNLGNITDVRMESMLISAKVAKERSIPVVLDVAGVACSGLRRRYACELMGSSTPDVIKGNYSEIKALYDDSYTSVGVDADATLDAEGITQTTANLAKKYECIVLATGEDDIVTDGERVVVVKNGTGQLSTVTGTGCILGALCGCFMAVSGDMDAVVCACVLLGVCGQHAQTERGSGSFMVNLMDSLSTATEIESEAKIVEKF